MARRIHLCTRCKTRLLRDGSFDAYYCPRCDRWAEDTCGDPECEFCSGRPLRPSQRLNAVRVGPPVRAALAHGAGCDVR
jgi:hypothetical protein